MRTTAIIFVREYQLMIPFSPPRIDDKTIRAVTEVLRSGWITTGLKTRELEKKINAYTSAGKTLCLNSWTNAAELILRWYGIGPGDEVIVPAYTYAATANIVVHTGATPVIVDSDPNDFNISPSAIAEAITKRTKAIIPVDVGGLPCDYHGFNKLASDASHLFNAACTTQEQLGRILVMSDSAHSFGSRYCDHITGNQCDVHGFSFHAVKNLTTAEGGAVTLNFPPAFDLNDIWSRLNISALHGQTRDALSKSKPGQWRYDIVEAGYKCNMTDIHAAIGLVEMDRYEEETLPRRKKICEQYLQRFNRMDWFIPPVFRDDTRESSYHLFMLRVWGMKENQRDMAIDLISEKGVSVNVHFQPLPLLSFYRNRGFSIEDFPHAMKHYSSEISLPVFYDLRDEDVQTVCDVVIESVSQIMER